MVQVDGIDVYMVYQRDHTQRYTEHPVPFGSKAYRNDPYERYIEVVNAQRFAVAVEVSDGFEVGRATHIKIHYRVDTTSRVRTIPVETLRKKHVFDTISRRVNDKWMECGFVFNVLTLDEEIDHDQDDVARAIHQNGVVQVEIERVRAKKTQHKKRELWTGHDSPDATTMSMEVVKKEWLTHGVLHKVLEEGKQPEADCPEDWFDVDGKKKMPKITIRYRSAVALEMLKIIAPRVLDEEDIHGITEMTTSKKPTAAPSDSRKRTAEQAGLTGRPVAIKLEKFDTNMARRVLDQSDAQAVNSEVSPGSDHFDEDGGVTIVSERIRRIQPVAVKKEVGGLPVLQSDVPSASTRGDEDDDFTIVSERLRRVQPLKIKQEADDLAVSQSGIASACTGGDEDDGFSIVRERLRRIQPLRVKQEAEDLDVLQSDIVSSSRNTAQRDFAGIASGSSVMVEDEPTDETVKQLEEKLARMREIHVQEGKLAAARAALQAKHAHEEKERRDARVKRLMGEADVA